MYLDALMNEGKALDWGICGVGVLEADRRMAEVTETQDDLYTLVLKHADGRREARVIGSIGHYLYPPHDPHAVLQRMTHPATPTVSPPVTEGGYHKSASTGEFDDRDPAIRADIEAAAGTAPQTTFGYIVEALRRRRADGAGPFTVMSCDNIQGNGHVAHAMITAYARRKDPDLAEWIEQQVPFPNSMVDRITPRTTDDDRQELEQSTGISDAWPVVCEPFTQWVLEDRFAAGRPPVEEVGVQVVDDVEPYELMKLRLLN